MLLKCELFPLVSLVAGKCLLKTAEVTLADGTHRQLQHIRLGDRVASWDAHARQIAAATVTEVESFEVEDDDLVELVFSRAAVDGNDHHSIIMTADHPVYSARLRSLVSMAPSQTYQFYNLTVGQMHPEENLHHFNGHEVVARVRPWTGGRATVMSIHLDQHHWFFAHGVRVHNKGRGGSSFHTSKSKGGGTDENGGSSATTLYTRASFESDRSYAFFVLQHMGRRRRHGTFEQEADSKCVLDTGTPVHDTCNETMALFESSGNVSAPQLSVLENSMVYDSRSTCCKLCHDCLACWTESCIQETSYCIYFLANAFSSCTVHEADPVDEGFTALMTAAVIGFVALVVACVGTRFAIRWYKKRYVQSLIESMQRNRENLKCCNAQGLAFLSLRSMFQEDGIDGLAEYILEFNMSGDAFGIRKCEDQVGGKLKGKLNWNLEEFGRIAWIEQHLEYDVEFDGVIQRDNEAINIIGTYVYPFRKCILKLFAEKAEWSYEAPLASQALVDDAELPGTPVASHDAKQLASINSEDAHEGGGYAEDAHSHGTIEPSHQDAHEGGGPFQGHANQRPLTEDAQNVELSTATPLSTSHSPHLATASPCQDRDPEEEGHIVGVPLTPEVAGTLLCAGDGCENVSDL